MRAPPALQVYALHRLGRIARPGGGADRRGGGDALQVVARELDFERVEVLVDALLALGAGDRNDLPALREQPGEHELRRRAFFLRGELLEALDDLHVRVEVLGLEARVLQAAIAFGQVRLALHRAGEHATPERRVSDERDAELAAAGERFLAVLPVEQRILVLHRRDRMHLVRAADRFGPRLRQAELAHFALLEQALHRAHRVLDRRIRVDTVLVVEVDDVDAQALQARLASLHHVIGLAVHALLALGVLGLAELGADDHALAAALERFAEQRLVVAPAVHVGGVEEVDALVERVVDDADRFLVVGVAVDARHRHQAQADRRYLEGALAQRSHFHPVSYSSRIVRRILSHEARDRHRPCERRGQHGARRLLRRARAPRGGRAGAPGERVPAGGAGAEVGAAPLEGAHARAAGAQGARARLGGEGGAPPGDARQSLAQGMERRLGPALHRRAGDESPRG